MHYEKRPVGHMTKNIGGLVLPKGPVSTRCKAEHDTPKGFSARCILGDQHETVPVQVPNGSGYAVLARHEDKYGNRWETT